MVIELRAVQFWSEIILLISNRTRADFEITRMISDQSALTQFHYHYSYYHKKSNVCCCGLWSLAEHMPYD